MPPQGGAVPAMSITAKGRGGEKRAGEVPGTGTERGQGEGCCQQQSCASFTAAACVTVSCPHLGQGPVPFLSGWVVEVLPPPPSLGFQLRPCPEHPTTIEPRDPTHFAWYKQAGTGCQVHAALRCPQLHPTQDAQPLPAAALGPSCASWGRVSLAFTHRPPGPSLNTQSPLGLAVLPTAIPSQSLCQRLPLLPEQCCWPRPSPRSWRLHRQQARLRARNSRICFNNRARC